MTPSPGGCSSTARASAFQAEGAGSTPVTRSVYVVTIAYPYEGESFVGAYSTLELAQAAAIRQNDTLGEWRYDDSWAMWTADALHYDLIIRFVEVDA